VNFMGVEVAWPDSHTCGIDHDQKPGGAGLSERETPAMFTGIATHTGPLVTAIVVLTGAAILRGGATSADPNQDDQFLLLLGHEGVPAISGVPDLIETAHKVCGKLDGGVPADAVVDELVKNANSITPGADPDRLRRTETRFVIASAGAYCPNHQVGFANRVGLTHRAKLTSFVTGADVTSPVPPAPHVPDAEMQKPPQAVAPAPPKKTPPVVGPPGRGGGGSGIGGGGTGGVAPTPPTGPGIITLAP
jgi:Protein of unknown function (DUF732)